MTAVEPSFEPLLTSGELAAALRVPLATVYRWRRYGKGPKGYRVGKRVLFRLSDAERWLQEQAS